jgi:hypothetical protein
MTVSLINGLVSAGEGYLMTGSPGVALTSGAIGAIGGSGLPSASNAIGSIDNAGMGALDAQDEAFQLGMYGEEIRHQETMQMQSEAFDEMMDEKSENMREMNTLRDVQMQQRKADDGITKKFIESITE